MTEGGKICTKCGAEKPGTEFYRSTGNKSGLMSWCKDCESLRGKVKYLKTRDHVLERTAANRAKNPDRYRSVNKAWYEANKETKLAKAAEWRRANPEKCREYTKKWESAHPEAKRAREQRRRDTPRGKVENSIRAGINKGISCKDKLGNKTFEILGYSPKELMAHLERQFSVGMSWGNYGHGDGCWHIDHIIPVAAHNYITPFDLDFRKCWDLSNLRPLWAEENRAKSDKLDKPFQPSLAIAIPTPANDNMKGVAAA